MPRALATETRELRKAPSACLPGPITRTVYNYLYIRQHDGVIPLAQKIQMLFVDDIDGGEAEGTVRFGLDGVGYEIDLSVAHSEELHKAG
jgi:Lsr2